MLSSNTTSRIARTFITRHQATIAALSTTLPRRRPFRILGLQQVAIGLPISKNQSLKQLWGDILGVPNSSGGIQIASEQLVETILKLGTAPHAVEIDLMSPVDRDTNLKKVKTHVPPLNHIGLWVDDLETAVSWMTKAGVRFTAGGIRMGAAGHRVAFIHPQANTDFPIAGNGMLLELVQAPDHVIVAAAQDESANGEDAFRRSILRGV